MAVWLAAECDLARMRAGLMDPAGRLVTARARDLGDWGAGFGICAWLVVVAYLLRWLLPPM
jgi:hypothetical protein